MSPPAFDQILRRLKEADVEFVLVGGLASSGLPSSQLRLMVMSKKARHFSAHLFRLQQELAGGERVAIETELGLLDVVQGLDGVPQYADLRASAVDTEILGVKVAVCSIDALRQMKRTAGRPRDRVDLEDLDATGN